MPNKYMLSPSMMCADLTKLRRTLSEFEKLSVEYLHIDIMDGEFVPNITLGTDFLKLLRNITDIPLDIHLMIKSPEKKLDWFDIRPGEIVSIHCESTPHVLQAVKAVRDIGAKPFAALNPATPLNALDPLYDEIDGVLIMSVNPGFAGQKIIPSAFEKVKSLRSRLNDIGLSDTSIEVDGNISFENAVKMKDAGADIFVGGTSSVFFKNSLSQNITKLRKLLNHTPRNTCSAGTPKSHPTEHMFRGGPE